MIFRQLSMTVLVPLIVGQVCYLFITFQSAGYLSFLQVRYGGVYVWAMVYVVWLGCNGGGGG